MPGEGKLLVLYSELRKLYESGKMREAKARVSVDSNYDAEDLIYALNELFNALLGSWLDRSGHEPDMVNARLANVEVCTRVECRDTWIPVNAELSDYEVEKLVRALVKLIDILAPLLKPPARQEVLL